MSRYSRSQRCSAPVIATWSAGRVERRHGVLTNRLTEVLTGHGSFGLGGRKRPGVVIARTNRRTRWGIRWRCPVWAEHHRVVKTVTNK
ncbi:hypothetical protein SFRURICE_015825 [Spodoptera frugiperda]|nr:hypothetical protein SFRURICE_015825 [Spodoptera frugiperda]